MSTLLLKYFFCFIYSPPTAQFFFPFCFWLPGTSLKLPQPCSFYTQFFHFCHSLSSCPILQLLADPFIWGKTLLSKTIFHFSAIYSLKKKNLVPPKVTRYLISFQYNLFNPYLLLFLWINRKKCGTNANFRLSHCGPLSFEIFTLSHISQSCSQQSYLNKLFFKFILPSFSPDLIEVIH